MSSLLNVEHLSMRFGGLLAIDDVSFAANKGEITAIIGPNGAGKTTIFNCLTGFYTPTIGRLSMQHEGRQHLLERMEAYAISQKAGIARTFQNIRLFDCMSVLENMMVAQHNMLMRASGFSLLGLIGWPSFKEAEQKALELAEFWLRRVGLIDLADWDAGNLPYGAQRRLEIARAMATQPALLCLDEPAAGLNPKESAELGVLLQEIRDEHKTAVMLIEHDMSVVMNISDHVIVVDYGKKISDGTAEQVRNDPAVIKAYLGEE